MTDLYEEKTEEEILYVFKGTIILKIIHAIIEIIGGVLTLVISRNFIVRILLSFTRDEIQEDTHDKFSNFLIHLAQSYSIHAKYYISFYLLSHGIVNGFLAIALLKRKLWAYPTSIIIFSLSSLYQLFRYTITHSIWLLLFTILNIILIGLIWHEYKIQKKLVLR